MKRFTIIMLAIGLTLGLNLNAQEEKAVGVIKEEAVKKEVVKEDVERQLKDGARLEFAATTVNYGTIEQNSDPLRVFTFTNTGNEPLIITNAKGSCGCTVPKYAKEPVLPGQSSEIEVRYDTKRVGPFNKSITLTTNAVNGTDNGTSAQAGIFRLKIKGKVNAAGDEIIEGTPLKLDPGK